MTAQFVVGHLELRFERDTIERDLQRLSTRVEFFQTLAQGLDLAEMSGFG